LLFIKGAYQRKAELQKEEKREDDRSEQYHLDQEDFLPGHLLPLNQWEELKPFMEAVDKSERSQHPQAVGEFQVACLQIFSQNGNAQKKESGAVKKIDRVNKGNVRE